MANLIPRFYDPTEGRVLIDGVDIRKAKLASLRKNISMVSQDVFLFNGTVAENIAYGSPHASRKQIEEAARPVPTSSSGSCPTATIPISANGESACQAARSRGWP
ncbi:MAG: ATP-binding cassette domain-containing protein [Bacillota bacterium]|jgi:ABC-type multidrug transport system fused ATPase/permease subunit